MTNRRDFLHSAVVLGMFSLPTARLVSSMPFGDKTAVEDPGWKPHIFRKGDGRGGWIYQSAQYRALNRPDGRYVMAFGLAAMDNDEVIFAGSWHDGSAESADRAERPVVAFSRDGCVTWTTPEPIEGARGRPVMLTYLGKGELMFQTDLEAKITQFFSHDYGRRWERQPLQLASNGENFSVEGNALVDRATEGKTRISEVGYNLPKGRNYPEDPTNALIRWSDDGGHTWNSEASPSAWQWKEHYEGRTYVRSISEGSLVRAANGWLVAALRTDMPPRFFKYNNDNLEGIGISLSKDEGKTWSPVQVLYESGRMHAHLLRMPTGTLVLTYVMRQDIDGGKLVSYRRGCGAVVSRDNGQTWDLASGYILDEFEFADGKLNTTTCGHLFSTVLNDHSVLTAYSNYLTKSAVLIRWRPDA